MREELGRIKTALHLMNSMILSGEEHSKHSKGAYERAKEAIERLEARPEAAQVRVKEISWQATDYRPNYIRSDNGIATYALTTHPDDVQLSICGTGWVLYKSVSEAKAAAQADYEKRILSALEPDPVATALSELAANQEPLGEDFERVLHENIEELYETQPNTVAQPDDVTPEAVAQLRDSAKKEIESDEWELIDGWRDISTAPKISVDEIVSIIEKTEVSDMTKDGDKRWVNRMAEALYHKLSALPPAPEKEG